MHGSSSTESFIPMSSIASGKGVEVTPDIYSYTTQIVNVCFIGNPAKDDRFVLVDAGMPNSASMIIKEAEERFGEGKKPKAIILTHAHFDHIGAIIELVEKWQIPVYAHTLELPYVTGKKIIPHQMAQWKAGL
jgi:glyoxylase-like metal-dependent hydrolase (beta-lactamase superfamily II)